MIWLWREQHWRGEKMTKLVREPKNQSQADLSYIENCDLLWSDSEGSNVEKLEAFTKYISRQSLTKFIARTEVFKKQLHINGSVLEVGVHRGASFMTWAHLSSILEPVNYLRQIIGFDTFSGFTDLSEKDSKGTSDHLEIGGFNPGNHAYQNLMEAIQLYDKNRLMGHITKCQLIKGDAKYEIPKYLESNPHTLISLLHLDADLYEPTKVALQHIVPRMPKGAIILFDELNLDQFPGETNITSIRILNNGDEKIILCKS